MQRFGNIFFELYLQSLCDNAEKHHESDLAEVVKIIADDDQMEHVTQHTTLSEEFAMFMESKKYKHNTIPAEKVTWLEIVKKKMNLFETTKTKTWKS